jgi:MinD superfamily P-loop ATPase
MTSESLNLTRRKFMLVSSAAVATPSLLNLSGMMVPEAKAATKGKFYFINRTCIGCYCCKLFCPANAVILGDCRLEIDQEKCIHCGACYKECPICAISET